MHAPTVHIDLEDPTLMEIAEFLDSQAGDKYTVMLVRNGDDLDTAGFVHIQMHNEDSCESLRWVEHVWFPSAYSENKTGCICLRVTSQGSGGQALNI